MVLGPSILILTQIVSIGLSSNGHVKKTLRHVRTALSALKEIISQTD